MTEDEMVGWCRQLNGHEFEQALGVGDGQEGLACCSPWGCKESDTTERLDNKAFTELTRGRGIPRAEHCWQKSDAIAPQSSLHIHQLTLLHVENLIFVIKLWVSIKLHETCSSDPARARVVYRLPGRWSVHPPSLPASFHLQLSPAWTRVTSKVPDLSSPRPPCWLKVVGRGLENVRGSRVRPEVGCKSPCESEPAHPAGASLCLGPRRPGLR